MTKSFRSFLLAGLALFVSSAFAATSCPAHYAAGVAPAITNPRVSEATKELCYAQFAVMHSGLTRTPLWSAEHLTAERIGSARGQVRVNDFHPDRRLSPRERAELSDYARSGYDRGHMAPSGDMPDPASQDESFSLANMVPQDAQLNRHLWEGIESAVRNLAQRRGELYVITGPLFEGDKIELLKHRVMVPTSVYKIVYDPRAGQASAYVAPNTGVQQYEVVSVAALSARAGIDFLPSLSAAAKQRAMALPAPQEHGKGGADGSHHHRRPTLPVVDTSLTHALMRQMFYRH
jgi:endonuclease G, mitochondrial